MAVTTPASLAGHADEADAGLPPRSIELTIGGMTCASCAARVEKKLNKLEGVTATVNYSTEKAKVFYPASIDPAQLVATVEATGDRKSVG